jgi:hypothetical protein
MAKTIKVKVDDSTWRWLRAFARVNSHTQDNQHKVTPAELLSQAAVCMAEHAGRDTKFNWRASVAARLLDASGYQKSIPFNQQEKLRKGES